MARGRSGRPWTRLKAEVYARREPCIRCGQPVNYALPYIDPTTGRPDPHAKSVDHFPHPLSTHPHLAEDPANCRAAHLGCNWSAGASGEQRGVAETSEDW